MQLHDDTPKYIHSRSFTQSNIDHFKDCLHHTNWNDILNDQMATSSYSNFSVKFSDIYNRCFPLRRKRICKANGTPHKPWISKAILRSIRRKDKLYRKYRSSQTDSNKRALSVYKNKLTTVIRAAKKRYYCDLLNIHKRDLKKTWQVLNDLLGNNRKKTLPDSFVIDGSVVSDPQHIADGLNDFFVNIGPKLACNIPQTTNKFSDFLTSVPAPIHSLFLSPTDDEEIADICSKIKSGTSSGHDEIKPDIVKAAVDLIKKPLCHVFNLSISSGIVPDELKVARVVPIFKSGDPTMCNNYRPISVLSVFSKIFETIIHKRLYGFLNKLNLLHKCQFGFRKNHSSFMALLEAYDKIISDLDKGYHSLGIFLDLSKAFDTIDHRILLAKLQHYGVRGRAFEWFESYLTNRTQYITFKDHRSSLRTIQCGVPQGSVLGPLLFIIFLNDIAFSSDKLSFITYADDTNVIISNPNLSDLIDEVNNELCNLSVWFKSNKLSLNINKTNYMVFKNRYSNRNYNDLDIYIDGVKLSRVSCTKFLGVIVDDSLTWTNHTSNVVNIMSKYCGILYRLKDVLPSETLLSLYNTLVLPHLTYCNIIWGDPNNTNLHLIYFKQKKIVRICTNSQWLTHSSPLFKKLNILTIYDIHKLIIGSFMYNYTFNKLPINFTDYFTQNNAIHNYPTRISHKYRPHVFKSNLARNTIRRQGPLLWNTLNDDLKNTKTVNVFKRKYKTHLISYYI